jgi:hypothetical protein
MENITFQILIHGTDQYKTRANDQYILKGNRYNTVSLVRHVQLLLCLKELEIPQNEGPMTVQRPSTRFCHHLDLWLKDSIADPSYTRLTVMLKLSIYFFK